MKKNVAAGQIFYLHTEPLVAEIPSWGPRATVAVAIINDSMFWGVAICSDNDNFERAKGRELALSRLRNGFGRIQMTDFHEKTFESTSQCLCATATGIAEKISADFGKWKHRINDFEENLAATIDEPELAVAETE